MTIKPVMKRAICAKYLTESLQNMCATIENRKINVRYSARTINVDMSLYMRSKKSYDNLRSSGLIYMPYPSTLKKVTKYLKIYPEGDPNIY